MFNRFREVSLVTDVLLATRAACPYSRGDSPKSLSGYAPKGLNGYAPKGLSGNGGAGLCPRGGSPWRSL